MKKRMKSVLSVLLTASLLAGCILPVYGADDEYVSWEGEDDYNGASYSEDEEDYELYDEYDIDDDASYAGDETAYPDDTYIADDDELTNGTDYVNDGTEYPDGTYIADDDELTDGTDYVNDGTEYPDDALYEETSEEESFASDDTASDGEPAQNPEAEGQLPDPGTVITAEGPGQTVTDIGPDDTDEMFRAYVERIFYSENASDDNMPASVKASASAKASYAGRFSLGPVEEAIYQVLSAGAADIAAGNKDYSVFTITAAELGIEKTEWTAEDLGVSAIVEDNTFTEEALNAVDGIMPYNLSRIMNVLLASHPYDFYWYDKTRGVSTRSLLRAVTSGGEWVLDISNGIEIKMTIASDYAAEGQLYVYDGWRVIAAQDAADHARDIVTIFADLPDHDKLREYFNQICQRTSYNYEAAEADHYDGTNPWQLVWVFDDDPETTVVCEGYAKAFQYLCDLSTFDSPLVSCICVTGTMDGGTGAGEHMWNVVRMPDGDNYLVDVTNCDEGTTGEPDQLFLKGSNPYAEEGSVDNGYIFITDGGVVRYCYDQSTLDLYSRSVLALHNGESYDPDAPVENCSTGHHTWNTSYTVDTEATCTQEGARSIHCEICGAVQEGSEEVIPMREHSYGEWYALIEESCGQPGEYERKCSVCQAIDHKHVQPTGNHTWETEPSVEVAADCQKEGVKAIHCTVCHMRKPGTVITSPRTAHPFGDWIVEIEPTCEGSGRKVRFCTVCHFMERVTIPANGHSFGNWTVTTPPTCVEDGVQERICSVCEKKEMENIPATGIHTWNDFYTVDLEPTEEAEGEESIHCSACGAVQEGSERPIPIIGTVYDFSEEAVISIDAQTYTGEPLTPDVKVTFNGAELVRDTDFTVAYKDNTDAGTAWAVITGIGNYAGNAEAAFTINAKSLNAADIAGISDQVYTGTAFEPKPVVTLDGTTLVQDQDYELAYKYNINVSESEAKRATVAVKGKGNYKGTAVVRFWIRPASLAGARVTGITDKTYTGQAFEPKPVVKMNGKTLKPGTDYTLAYKYNINVSESEAKRATVAVKGMGNYKGTAVVRFWIKPASLKNAEVTGLKTVVYNGSAFKPKPVVKLNGKTLKLDRDYYLAYKNNTNPGRATIAVKGKGNYNNVAVKYFAINPKPSWIAKLATPKTKQIGITWAKRGLISGYQIEISAKRDFSSGKMQKTVYDPAKLTMTVTVSKAKTTYYVRVRTFKKASGKTYFSAWSAVKSVVTK